MCLSSYEIINAGLKLDNVGMNFPVLHTFPKSVKTQEGITLDVRISVFYIFF